MGLKKVLLVFVSILLAWSLSLAVDRALGSVLNRSGYFTATRPNQTIVYDTMEFRTTATISAQGLRNEVVAMPKPHGVTRILALGDSFTYGWGVDVDRAWPKLLEQELHTAGTRAEVINAGVPGIGLRKIRLVCQAYAQQFDVDAVIVGVHTDDFYQAASLVQSQGPAQQAIADLWPTLTRIGETIIQESDESGGTDDGTIDASIVWKKRVDTMLGANPRLLLALDPNIRSSFVFGKINPFLLSRAVTDPQFYMVLQQADLATYIEEAVAGRLDRLDRRCTKNLPVFIAFIPSGVLVSEQYLPYRRAFGFTVDANLVSVDIDRVLGPLAGKYGYLYVSMLPSFRSDGCLDCFYPYDGHLTAAGHERVVEAVLPQVKKWLNQTIKRGRLPQ